MTEPEHTFTARYRVVGRSLYEQLADWAEQNGSPPRCPHCCTHGVPDIEFCGWCDDINEGMTDCIVWTDDEQWLCPHGIGKDIRAWPPA